MGGTRAGSLLREIGGWARYALGRLAWCVALLLGLCVALAAVAEVAAHVGLRPDSFFYFYLETLITTWSMCKVQLMQRLTALPHVLDDGFATVLWSGHQTFVDLTGYFKSAAVQGLDMGWEAFNQSSVAFPGLRTAFVVLTGYFKSAADHCWYMLTDYFKPAAAGCLYNAREAFYEFNATQLRERAADVFEVLPSYFKPASEAAV